MGNLVLETNWTYLIEDGGGDEFFGNLTGNRILLQSGGMYGVISSEGPEIANEFIQVKGTIVFNPEQESYQYEILDERRGIVKLTRNGNTIRLR